MTRMNALMRHFLKANTPKETAEEFWQRIIREEETRMGRGPKKKMQLIAKPKRIERTPPAPAKKRLMRGRHAD